MSLQQAGRSHGQALLIRGATIYDGTGAAAARGDVSRRRRPDRRRRAATWSGRPAAGRSTRDGLALAPGFIDIHSHADFTLPAYPDAINSLSQGVTSEVIGNCGYSPAPLSPDARVRARVAGRRLGASGPTSTGRWRTFARVPRRRWIGHGRRSTACRWWASARCASRRWAWPTARRRPPRSTVDARAACARRWPPAPGA